MTSPAHSLLPCLPPPSTRAIAVTILSLPPPHPPTRRPGPPDPVTSASSLADLATLRRGEADSRPLRPRQSRFARFLIPHRALMIPLRLLSPIRGNGTIVVIFTCSSSVAI
uniref:Uncharacterized protein n=1 Tax=Oryza sativa subsp. japonica TaxID=39947 RepID=Q6ZH06_ORYSJ|nr:hypothetical protein [Oryza sativa Japonica Group]